MLKAIDTKNLSVYYGKTCALDSINLSVPAGDFLCILGPNGGGKSTLLKSLLGLIKPTKGTITLFGHSPDKNNTIVGYVPQTSTIEKNFPITVKNVILTGLLINKKGFFQRFNEQDHIFAEKVMKEINILDLQKRHIGQLSGGQLKRVLIARALIMKPQILLLDEPTANLDNKAKKQTLSLLKSLSKQVTIVLVTHDNEIIDYQTKDLAYLNTRLSYYKKPGLTGGYYA